MIIEQGYGTYAQLQRYYDLGYAQAFLVKASEIIPYVEELTADVIIIESLVANVAMIEVLAENVILIESLSDEVEL